MVAFQRYPVLGSGEERCQGRDRGPQDRRPQDRHSSATPKLTSSSLSVVPDQAGTRTGRHGLSQNLTFPAGTDFRAVI